MKFSTPLTLLLITWTWIYYLLAGSYIFSGSGLYHDVPLKSFETEISKVLKNTEINSNDELFLVIENRQNISYPLQAHPSQSKKGVYDVEFVDVDPELRINSNPRKLLQRKSPTTFIEKSLPYGYQNPFMLFHVFFILVWHLWLVVFAISVLNLSTKQRNHPIKAPYLHLPSLVFVNVHTLAMSITSLVNAVITGDSKDLIERSIFVHTLIFCVVNAILFMMLCIVTGLFFIKIARDGNWSDLYSFMTKPKVSKSNQGDLEDLDNVEGNEPVDKFDPFEFSNDYETKREAKEREYIYSI